MPLVFGDEVSTPYIKFNAKENAWATNNRDGDIQNIDPPRMLIDLDQLQLGWFRFREAQAPDIVLDPPGTEAAEPDGGNHKRGFRVQTYSPTLGVREFSSNSLMLKKAMILLYKLWEADKAQNPNKLPLVEVTDHVAVNGRYGTNYKPVFDIVGWYDRPDELSVPSREPETHQTSAQQPAAPKSNVAPLPTKAKTPLAEELGDEIPW